MQAHVIENGKVINTVEVESLDVIPGLIAATVGGVGWLWDGSALSAPVETTSAEQDAKTITDKESQLWSAADAYTTGQISGVAIGILAIGVMLQKPKALAISAWSKSLWDEYYVRKSGITATSALNLDFSSFGEMPYTVPELTAEIGL